MPQNVIVDAGPIVAFLRTSDRWHDWATAQFKRHRSLLTCDAVISEACARLAYYGNDQNKVIDLLLTGALTLRFNCSDAIERISRLMKKYADQPMDFADACVVIMSEQVQRCVVVTVDETDFSVYRRWERDVIPTVTPHSQGAD